MIKKIIPQILILPAIVLVIYVASYLLLREYQYADTKHFNTGAIGVNYFSYFDRQYSNAYPMTLEDAKFLASIPLIFKKKTIMEPLIFFFPLERLELFFRGKQVVKLSKQEELDILKEEEKLLKSMKDLPY